MGTRSIRLDEETEKALRRLTRMSGLSISEVLKRGVFAYQAEVLQQSTSKPYEIYRKLDLLSGCSARAPARDAKKAVADVISRSTAVDSARHTPAHRTV